MFHKQFRVKSQTAIKGSDRKKLRGDIGRHFDIDPNLLTKLIPNKEEMTVMKIYTHSGDNVIVYNIHGNPAFFEIFEMVYPTVYTLWKYPDLLPVFTTWPPVLTKLQSGADLMLPGVIVIGDVTPTTFGQLKKGATCCVKLLGNKAPVAVGKTALSGSDMYESAMRGKGILILHTYGDTLWSFGNKTNPPQLDDIEMLEAMRKPDHPADQEDSDNVNCPLTNGENACSNICENSDSKDTLGINQLSLGSQQEESPGGAAVGGTDSQTDEECEPEDPKLIQERMDDLLGWCFKCALKSRIKKSDLPLLTSTFFRNHMQPCCAPGETIDVKKSSYKKLSKFLKVMQDQGFIKVKELTRGVESITEVTRDHPQLREFTAPVITIEKEETPSGTTATDHFKPPRISVMYMVSGSCLPFFKLCGYGKGAALSSVDVRTCLTDYVRENNMQGAESLGYVTLDPMMSDLVLAKGEYLETVTWENLLSRALNKMSPGYQLVFPGQKPILKKGKLAPIVLNVMQRGGNKKVTLIHSLETYGIDPHEFAHQVQINVACSTSVSTLPGQNQGQEVLVQGNQINFVEKLLLDKYQIPRKYIQGLEKAPKSGKKKR